MAGTLDLLGEVAELKRKAALYDGQRERYADYAHRLRGLADGLQKLADDFDPVLAAGRENRSYADEVARLHGQVVAGVHLSMDLARAALPELEESQVRYVFNRVAELPGVRKRKDGVKVFLYGAAA